MAGTTEAWDDSGTALGVNSDLTAAESALFILDESADNVGIAMQPLAGGDVVLVGGEALPLRTSVPAMHKVALVDIVAGDRIRKLGHTIGVATAPIRAGEHVHIHNLGLPSAQPAEASATAAARRRWHPGTEVTRRSFLGYRRADGRVGTRNYI